MSPGKAYVKGYEIETIGTTYIDVEKARDFLIQKAILIQDLILVIL